MIGAALLFTFKLLYGQNLLVCVRIENMFKIKRFQMPNVRIDLRSNHIFELNSMIGAPLPFTFTLNYGLNILVWVRVRNKKIGLKGPMYY